MARTFRTKPTGRPRKELRSTEAGRKFLYKWMKSTSAPVSSEDRNRVQRGYDRVKKNWALASRKYRARKSKRSMASAKKPGGYKSRIKPYKDQSYYGYRYRRVLKNQGRMIIGEFERYISLIVQNYGFEILSNLRSDPRLTGTPIDTGWASENWVAGVADMYPRAPIGHRPPRGRLFMGASPRMEYIFNYNIRQGPLRIVNNVPYIGIINQSKKLRVAAPMFIERSIQKAKLTLIGLGKRI